jgi:hypothetical protein
MSEYTDILNTVVDNGRVLAHDDGSFVTASLEAEVEFEAGERELSPEETEGAVAFALAHAEHHG